ncbi:MAG: C-GCAxxG-C-C family protein [Desulfurococcales archaeon]|nr:C-GCAxxG-C-C family protein [Desulfurococcales archaeon]MEB3789038.1 C-GCAxxG-C-C family protein [Desulfurococcales archaeon]
MNPEDFEKLVDSTKKRASDLLSKTWNCALSPLVALYESLGLELTPEIEGAAIGFAGGISGNRHICGALWAAVNTVGAYTRKIQMLRGSPPQMEGGMEFIEANKEIHELASIVYGKFVELFGSPNCGDLNPRFDLVSHEQQLRCRALVRKGTEIALRVLSEKYGKDLSLRNISH